MAVSSTRIRNALLKDEIELANEFLGYPFFISGKVNRGDQIGRTIGYPTANILVEETYKLIPSDGIFAVKVYLEERSEYKGMGYIGHRPTINGMTRTIEVNIFDFNEDIYTKPIRMELLHFVRGDIKFESLEQLTEQLGKDKVVVMGLFNS